MKKLIGMAAVVALAACSQSDDAGDAEKEAMDDAVEVVAEEVAADGGTPYGNFRVTTADGDVYTEVVNEDGTYTSTGADGEVETGTWAQKGDQYCTTEDAEGAEEDCHTESVNAEGVWTSVDNVSGDVARVERIEG